MEHRENQSCEDRVKASRLCFDSEILTERLRGRQPFVADPAVEIGVEHVVTEIRQRQGRPKKDYDQYVRAVIETGPASVSEMPPPEVRLVCGGRLDDLAVRCRPVVGS
jgi:hypothetical protein